LSVEASFKASKHSAGADGVDAHVLADAQQSALGALFERQAIPFGAAHRTHQHRIGGNRLDEGFVGSGRPTASIAAPPSSASSVL